MWVKESGPLWMDNDLDDCLEWMEDGLDLDGERWSSMDGDDLDLGHERYHGS